MRYLSFSLQLEILSIFVAKTSQRMGENRQEGNNFISTESGCEVG